MRQVSRPSILYFNRAERWWHIAAVSLPIDALFLLLITPGAFPPLSTDFFEQCAIVLGAVALAGLFRDTMLRVLETVWGGRGKLSEFRRRYGRTLIIGFTILAAAEAFIHFGQFGWLVLAAVGVVSMRAFHELSKLLQEARAREDLLDRDKLILLEQRNFQVFCVVITPILAARLYGFIGAIAATQQTLPETRWTAYLTAFVLGLAGLLALRPEREDFVTRCPRCSRPGSRVLRSFGGCPDCTREQFQITEVKPQPIRAERSFESKPGAVGVTPPVKGADGSASTSASAPLRRLLKRLIDSVTSRGSSAARG